LLTASTNSLTDEFAFSFWRATQYTVAHVNVNLSV
jgi:hypothetical protein